MYPVDSYYCYYYSDFTVHRTGAKEGIQLSYEIKTTIKTCWHPKRQKRVSEHIRYIKEKVVA